MAATTSITFPPSPHTHDYISPNTIATLKSIELSRDGTPYIDFHYNSSSADYTHRIEANESGLGIYLTGGGSLGVNGIAVSLSNHNHDGTYATLGSTCGFTGVGVGKSFYIYACEGNSNNGGSPTNKNDVAIRYTSNDGNEYHVSFAWIVDTLHRVCELVTGSAW